MWTNPVHDVLLSVQEVSELMSISCRAVRKNARLGLYYSTYVNGKGQGGRQILIRLDSLPIEAQSRYLGLSEDSKHTEFDLIDYETVYTEKQKADAEQKKHVIHCLWNSGKRVKQFLEEYNSDNGTNITERQLREWERKYKESNHSLESLIDRRGGYNKDTSSIPEEVWDAFYALYMTTAKRGAKLCYDLVKRRHPDIPSYGTFARRLQSIPEWAILQYREGKKALNDNLPSMIRDKSALQSNDIWCSDHHRCDVAVKNI